MNPGARASRESRKTLFLSLSFVRVPVAQGEPPRKLVRRGWECRPLPRSLRRRGLWSVCAPRVGRSAWTGSCAVCAGQSLSSCERMPRRRAVFCGPNPLSVFAVGLGGPPLDPRCVREGCKRLRSGDALIGPRQGYSTRPSGSALARFVGTRSCATRAPPSQGGDYQGKCRTFPPARLPRSNPAPKAALPELRAVTPRACEGDPPAIQLPLARDRQRGTCPHTDA
jgi:hypothetical protein